VSIGTDQICGSPSGWKYAMRFPVWCKRCWKPERWAWYQHLRLAGFIGATPEKAVAE
jgi:hypothetical protein